MRLKFVMGLTTVLLGSLFFTNTQDPSRYAKSVAERSQMILCVEPDSEICKAIQPLARPVVGGIVRMYTTSENRIFFSTYQTEMPCLDIYGIGILKQHIIWPVPSDSANCQLPNLTLVPL